MTSDEDRAPTCASPPCFMHEIASDPGLVDPRQRKDVMRWRKAERERLIQARLAIPAELRRAFSEAIAAVLEQVIGDVQGVTVSAYWPFRGEPDLRRLLERFQARGGRTALPVVVAPRQPLIFRAWTKGDPLERGVWNIPVPVAGAARAEPDVVIAPVVGYDPACYRLGYGGGFFDRTLAARASRPRFFGVGWSIAGLATIYPQPHDVPMDLVVTEKGVVTPEKDSHHVKSDTAASSDE
jgi:5,10-methenyltetrahydrofolate synthetase